jgi:gamma-glutamyl:cysteine ligase YbdK (ATP-grasp superfamily)
MEIKEQIEKEIVLVAINGVPTSIEGLKVVSALEKKLEAELPITLTEQDTQFVKHCVNMFQGWNPQSKEARKLVVDFAEKLK